MKIRVVLLLILAVASAHADQAVSDTQQILKEQGFYYGQVTGEKNADTSAAIRRFQIRNGLEITGELNEETVKSLHKAPVATPAPVATVLPAPTVRPTTPEQVSPQNDPGLRDESGNENVAPGPGRPFGQEPDGRSPETVYPGRVVPSGVGVLGGPYAGASLDVQQKIVAAAQNILGSLGLFKSPIDGVFGPDLEFSLRAYQSRVGLRPTGRLDLETLAALELLPGAHQRVYVPRRGRPSGERPPVRGEWIRP